jgi:hypothetical protein
MQDGSKTPFARARAFLVRSLFSVWAAIVIVPSAYMMAGHLLTLPVPAEGDPRVAAAVDATRAPDERGRWLAVHIMNEDCGCSQRLMTYLLSRRALADVRERIVLIGHDDALAKRARDAGFGFEELGPAELTQRYLAESAPMLMVANPAGKLLYVGGYADRRRGPDTKDLDVIHHLQRGERVEKLPLFGCAVSEKLQEDLDPLGLKYPRKKP